MRIAIVDDDEKQRKQLREFVERYSSEKSLDAVCFEFQSGLNFASDYTEPFDIILLDIEMPLMDGLTAAQYVRKTDEEAVIIFITHMAQYAIKGYEVNALDFMVKPVTYFNLATKLNRALKVLPRRNILKLDIAGGGTQILPLKDIHYVEGSNQYVIYHTLDREFKVHTSLKAAEEKLGRGFARCNNSFIVNLAHVSSIVGNDVYVGKVSLPISRSRKKEFVADVNRYFGGI